MAARARNNWTIAATDAALVDAVSPPQGGSVLITDADHDRLTPDLREADLQPEHCPSRPPGHPRPASGGPGQPRPTGPGRTDHVISHAIRIAAFDTAAPALARDVRVHTGYARANHEVHALIRQALTGSGDIDPHDGTLAIRLDPLATQRATAAIAQLCKHLTATQTATQVPSSPCATQSKPGPEHARIMTPCLEF